MSKFVVAPTMDQARIACEDLGIPESQARSLGFNLRGLPRDDTVIVAYNRDRMNWDQLDALDDLVALGYKVEYA